MLGTLLLVPLFLSAWPPVVYGEWLALYSVVAYLATLDLGMNMAAINRLTQAYARDDLDEYREFQRAGVAFYGLVSVVGTALLAAAAWSLPIPRWLGFAATPLPDARWVLWLLGVQTLLLMPIGFLTNVYRTMGNLARSQWIVNARQVTAFALTALTLVLSGDMAAVAGVQLIPLAAAALFVLWDVRRRRPGFVPDLVAPRRVTMRQLVRPSFLFVLIMIGGVITLQGSVLLVSTCFGGVAVGVFVTSRTLVNLGRQVVSVLHTALWPDLTSLEARGDSARLRALHRLLVTTAAAFSIAFGAALWFEGAEVISVWTRAKLVPDSVLLRLLLLQGMLQAPWLASSVFSAAFNRHRTLALAYIFSSILGLSVAAMLVGRLGTWAVPVGLMVGETVACCHFIPRNTCALIGEAYGRFALRQWLAMLGVAAVTFPVAWLLHQIAAGPTLLRWMGMGAATLVASVLTAWVVGLRADDREMLIRRLTPVVLRTSSRVATFRA